MSARSTSAPHLSARDDTAGDVVAVDANESRARELEENVRRLGADRVRVVHADGRALPPELTGFDRAPVDAPCSGLGVLAARPDLRWRSQPLPSFSSSPARRGGTGATRRHDRLLRVHDQRGRVGGVVVEATGLAVEPIQGWAQLRHPTRPAFLQTFPDVHGTSGFFVARLRVGP